MKTCSILVAIFLILALTLGYFLMFHPIGFLYATYENLYGEWLQFAGFAGIALFSFLIVVKKRADKRWFWALLGLAAFYVAMEEISWGQQIFGWKSSEFFQKQNQQGETNLHNIFTGPYSTVMKDLLTYVLAIGIFAYGVLYPLMVRFKIGIALFFERLGVPVPSLCLLPFFALAAYAELSIHRFNEAELAELFLALALFFMALTTYYNGQADAGENDGKSALRIGTGFLVALIIAFGMTQFSMNSDLSKRRVENRIEAGVKKFGGRYARIESWDHAIDLYKRHLEYDPESRSRLRRLAATYKSAGRFKDQQDTLQIALNLDLEKLKEDAWRASLHRSLYRTYRARGDMTNAKKHVNEALKINEQRLLDHPDSADAAYSIGRTYDLLGRRTDAIEQYKRAFELKPSSSKYRKAYREAID